MASNSLTVCYNTTIDSVTGISAFETLYGYKPQRLLSYVYDTIANKAIDKQLRIRDEIMILLNENLQQAQQRMKHFADRKRIERSFTVVD